jgi:hypothetical protein
MTTDPASAIKLEVHQLIDSQIETSRRESSLSPSELVAYNARSKRIQTLYRELDRLGRARFELGVARAS